MIMAERNQNYVKKFKEVFPEGTNITDELIIWWARDRASFHDSKQQGRDGLRSWLQQKEDRIGISSTR